MQDSTSMKTIAFITMAFLPGTFLASMFAMPVFPHDHIEKAFWLYWAICIPLTAIVFLIWLAWFYWHTITTHNDGPQRNLLYSLKAGWKGSHDPNSSCAKEHNIDTHDYVRQRLAGDNYKEWNDNFIKERLTQGQKSGNSGSGGGGGNSQISTSMKQNHKVQQNIQTV